MFELLHDWSAWLEGFASSPWAVLILAAASFCESIFFPIPPDPLLIGTALLQPHLALFLGALVTVSSVAGAVVGHWLGRRLGRPLLYRFFAEDTVLRVERLFQRYGAWATLVAAFTPLPYKVFAIAAGVLDMDRRTFVIASLVGRGARFMAIGLLVFLFRDEIEEFVSQNFEMLTVAAAAAAVAAAVAWALLHRARRSESRSRAAVEIWSPILIWRSLSWYL